MCSKRPLVVACKPIFVMPNNLPSIFQSDLIKVALYPAHMMMDSIDKEIPFRGEKSTALINPFFRPIKPLCLVFRLLPFTEVFLKIVRRICNYQLATTIW